MDPAAALALIRDTTADRLDRVEAAIALVDWIGRGGSIPADLPVAKVARLRDMVASIDGFLGII